MDYEFSRESVKVPRVSTEHRQIKTAIPAPGTSQILSEIEKYESRSMQGQMPIVWDSAEDYNVFDRHGNKWIDFTSTIFVANVGHSNKQVIDAIKVTLDKPLLHTYAYINELRLNYIKSLVQFAGDNFEKAFLMSSGTEATEAALKLMRLHGFKKNKKSPGIICIEGNYHGRTMGAHMMSCRIKPGDWAGHQDPNVYHIPFPYPWTIDGKSGVEFLKESLDCLACSGVNMKYDICGIMLETYQGWGAVFYPDDFVKAVDQICKENDILLAFDEIQAGFGRTGKKFGYEHYGVIPDLLCCGKGMGSGLPVSGVLGKQEVMDLPSVGEMSSTHSANPVICAAGLATINEIEEKNLVSEAKRKGELFFEKLQEIQKKYAGCISNICGKGLVAALIFKDFQGNALSILASKISERCMQKGVLVVHTGRESIKLAPPLTIVDEALVEGVAVIDEALGEIIQEG